MDSENRVYLIKELDRRTGQVFISIPNFIYYLLVFDCSFEFAPLQLVNAIFSSIKL